MEALGDLADMAQALARTRTATPAKSERILPSAIYRDGVRLDPRGAANNNVVRGTET
jgi:hypothetical protein